MIGLISLSVVMIFAIVSPYITDIILNALEAFK